MSDKSRPDGPVDRTTRSDDLHEWAEQIAIPVFDFVAEPIEAIIEGLLGTTSPGRRHRRTDRPTDSRGPVERQRDDSDSDDAPSGGGTPSRS